MGRAMRLAGGKMLSPSLLAFDKNPLNRFLPASGQGKSQKAAHPSPMSFLIFFQPPRSVPLIKS
jgi:hypothetical protein